MTHLSTEEFVDALDGVLPLARAEHLRTCAACRAEADGLAEVFSQAAEAREVVDRSPLFWEHLSARIRQDLATPVAHTGRQLAWWPGSGWAAGLASLVLVLLVSQSMFRGTPNPPREAPAALRTVVAVADPADDLDSDQAWAVVRTVADDAADDAAQDAGIATRPDAAERMTLELSSREKSELAQLIAGELKRSGT